MKHTILGSAALVFLLAACESAGGGEGRERREGDEVRARPASFERGAGDGYGREIVVRGTVVDAAAFLLRGERGVSETVGAATLALQSDEGLFLLLPPGDSASDRDLQDPNSAQEELLAFDLRSLRPGELVLLTGDVYRRDGLQAIEVESIQRE